MPKTSPRLIAHTASALALLTGLAQCFILGVRVPSRICAAEAPQSGRTASPTVSVPTPPLAGKNGFYFLTPLDRGRLQVLPVAYDVRRQERFDTTASASRGIMSLQEEVCDLRKVI